LREFCDAVRKADRELEDPRHPGQE
jgi:hypothetical protein